MGGRPVDDTIQRICIYGAIRKKRKQKQPECHVECRNSLSSLTVLLFIKVVAM